MGGTINHMANPKGIAPNIGSVFWFELPAAEAGPSVLSEPVQKASGFSEHHVLLVDDIKINRDIISSFLDAAGHTVTLAESGMEAVRLATEERFDLILMDVRMPGMDGLEAARQIRTLPGPHGQVPILALTAYTSLEQIGDCLDAGMDGHVPKPVNYETLIQAIETATIRVRLRHNGKLPTAAIASPEGQVMLPPTV
jgi:CheY-like chemotaxis protein